MGEEVSDCLGFRTSLPVILTKKILGVRYFKATLVKGSARA